VAEDKWMQFVSWSSKVLLQGFLATLPMGSVIQISAVDLIKLLFKIYLVSWAVDVKQLPQKSST